jgi:hypothetical protein
MVLGKVLRIGLANNNKIRDTFCFPIRKGGKIKSPLFIYICIYLYAHTLHFYYRISLTIVDTPGFGDNIDNEKW